MAAVIGDFIAGPSRFHNMIAQPALQHQHSHTHSHDSSPARYRSLSRSHPSSSTLRSQRPDPAVDYAQPASPHPETAPSTESAPAAPSPSTAAAAAAVAAAGRPVGEQPEAHVSSTGGASRFPSPPPSSSPSVSTGPAATDDEKTETVSMEAPIRDSDASGPTSRSGPPPAHPVPHLQQPSPPSDDYQIPDASYLVSNATPTPQAAQQTVIHVRDLAHVQSLAQGDMLSGSGGMHDQPLQQMKYEISGMPIGDIIEMVAALLTKITTTNDLQHDAMSRNVTHQQQANQTNDSSGSSSMSPLSHSVLAFHGKNVPAITILSYLSRIHKYCPTTYEVFLSLLVYFDRMTERVNDMVTKSEEARRQSASHTRPSTSSTHEQQDTAMHDDADLADSDESDSDLADDDDDDMAEGPSESRRETEGSSDPRRESSTVMSATDDHPATVGPATYFVVDSFNIHRLIISGVTCASKFFSDVFYTNSRYAKVGGLPLAELNHLELQFLVLNDFRLAVPVEDLEAYATMLVEFYAREVVAQRPASGTGE